MEVVQTDNESWLMLKLNDGSLVWFFVKNAFRANATAVFKKAAEELVAIGYELKYFTTHDVQICIDRRKVCDYFNVFKRSGGVRIRFVLYFQIMINITVYVYSTKIIN